MLAELTIALPLRFVKELIRRWFSGKETPNSLVICNVRAFVTSQTGFYVHEPSHISGRVAPGDLCQRGMALPLIQARKIAYRGYIHPRADPGWDRGRQLINKMNLVWGTRAYIYDKSNSTDETIADVENILKKDGHVKSGDIFIFLASMPIHERARTNTLKINIVK